MAKNTICLWYDKDAEAAARFYAATFPDSAVGAVHRAPSDYPSGKAGDVLTVDFTVAGIRCIGMNGGPMFKPNEAFSLSLSAPVNATIGNGTGRAIISDDEAAMLMGVLGEKPGQRLTVDLEQQTIQYGDQTFRFAIDPVRRTRLLNGWDNVTLTESYRDKIAAFKVADRARRPWARPSQ